MMPGPQGLGEKQDHKQAMSLARRPPDKAGRQSKDNGVCNSDGGQNAQD